MPFKQELPSSGPKVNRNIVTHNSSDSLWGAESAAPLCVQSRGSLSPGSPSLKPGQAGRGGPSRVPPPPRGGGRGNAEPLVVGKQSPSAVSQTHTLPNNTQSYSKQLASVCSCLTVYLWSPLCLT